jgi:chromosome segregation ATPase
MNPKDIKDWMLLGGMVVSFIITTTIAYQKLIAKINGMGGRVKKVEEACSATSGRMDRFERELAEYRRDAQDAVGRMSRVEKGVDALNDNIQQGNITIGSQLHAIEKLIQEKDKSTSNRLVRMETLQQVEKKLGPIPID